MWSSKASRLRLPVAHDDGHVSGSSTPSGMATPLRFAPKPLRPYIEAMLSSKVFGDWQSKGSARRKQLIKEASEKEGTFSVPLTSLFVGISAVFTASNTVVVSIAVHDSIYLHDFSVKTLELGGPENAGKDLIADFIIQGLEDYELKNFCKFVGAGVPHDLMKMSPKLCSRLWLELDIVPISLSGKEGPAEKDSDDHTFWSAKDVDEQSDSMARKSIMFFGPHLSPLLQVGYRGVVEVDAGFHAHLCTVENYKNTCGDTTWRAMTTYASDLRQNLTKIAFFSSTPQGGGVALMRHALVRFARTMKVDLTWYVPKPKPGVFRITKTVHNILQGVAAPGVKISAEEKQTLTDWINDNAQRYWLSKGGPLRPPSEGGADIIIIDDPQMPGLIPLIKEITPDRPVLYRSHIQIRSDLADKEGTPQEDIWKYLWGNIQKADLFISHPIPTFVPKNVPKSKVVYLPATTDWLDGLNKPMKEWDMRYYGTIYNQQCHSMRMTELKYPGNQYFIQIARFDPSKGIPDVIKSYAEFRKRLRKRGQDNDAPQLVIAGNGSVDDPDGSIIYDEIMTEIESHNSSLASHISVMRLDPNDQLLNTLISNAHTVLQLSTREGFEVKVSEGLHKGRPVIATNVGGIPLQVQHGKNGYLVPSGDWQAVAGHLIDLWTDTELHQRMSEYAAISVSDEVGTVGNALSWFYLASKFANGPGIKGEERWVNDLAREEAELPYEEGENRLPRAATAKRP